MPPEQAQTGASVPRVWIAAGVIVVLAAAGTVALLTVRQPSSVAQPASQYALFRLGLNATWYRVMPDGTVAQVVAPPSFASTPEAAAVEMVPALPSGAVPALVRTGPNTVATGFGLFSTAGAYEPLTTDSMPKESLTENAARTALAYAGLVASGSSKHFATEWHTMLYVVGAASSAVRDLGQGSDPHFLPNGDLLVASAMGIVEINPTSGVRSAAIRDGNFGPGAFTVSPDGRYAAALQSASSTAVYAIRATTPVTLAQVGATDYLALPFAFLPNGEFVTMHADVPGMVSTYSVSATGLTPVQNASSTSSTP